MRVLKYYVKIYHYLRHENKVNEKFISLTDELNTSLIT